MRLYYLYFLLVALAVAFATANSSCQGPNAGNPQTWWRAEIAHNGTTPYAVDPAFRYYRTVLEYGADSSGEKDSSDAFNRAIDAGDRTGNSATTLPVFIHVPAGTYRIKSPIQLLVSTFLIGDPLNPPTLVADLGLGDRPVINGYDDHRGEGSSTKNFYIAVRNLNIDTTGIASNLGARAINWSVSQGCSLTNVHITMPSSSQHTGITMDMGGSGKIISDCSFTGGAVGIRLASQQYMLKGLQFDGCGVGILVQTSQVSTIQGCSFANCKYGVDMGEADSSGALSIVDSSVSGCSAGVNTHVSGNGQGSLVLDNFAVSDAVAVRSSDGSTLLQGSVPDGQVWVMGNTNPDGYQSGAAFPIRRPTSLLVDGKYFTAPLPQYEKYDISQVASIKDDPEHPVYGDNAHDDGPSINAILRKNADCKIVFFPQGIYRTDETIHVPPGSRLVGEVFSVITGAGTHFSNPADPKPIVRLGNPGDRGVAQLTDLLISVSSVLPGAILLQVNMAGPAPGSVGLWNCVLRVGGSVDTLVTTQCAAPADPASCKAAFALFHLTSSAANVYLEDFWGWVADHVLDHTNTTNSNAQSITQRDHHPDPDSDDGDGDDDDTNNSSPPPAPSPPPRPALPSSVGQNIAVGRGALIESTSPAWFVGTSFEHCVLYQYALHGAANVYLGQHQTESPYWQGTDAPVRAQAPGPWAVEGRFGDPAFGGCNGEGEGGMCRRAWGLHVSGVTDVVVHGSAMWSFYGGMADGNWGDPQCTRTGGICQENMAFVERARGMWWFSASSRAARNLVVDGGGDGAEGGADVVITSQKEYPGGWGAVVGAYLRNTAGGGGGGGGGGEEEGEDSRGGKVTVSGIGLAVTAAGVMCARLIW